MIGDYFKIALENIVNRKLRAFLTTLGIVISVAAVITLILLGDGLTQTISEEFEKMGTSRITILGKGSGDPSFASESLITTADVDSLESLPYFEYVTPFVMIPAVEVEYRNMKEYPWVMGMPTDNIDKRFGDYDWKVLEGRNLNEKDKYNVVIGYKVWDEYFDRRISINTNIVIKDTKFRVVGILDKIGSDRDDSTIIMEMETLRTVFNKPESVNMIDVQVKAGFDPDFVAGKTKNFLKRKRGDENFQVMTYKQILEFLTTAIVSITAVLGIIAVISVFVGAIGIMNSMFTNVLERTNEIGIMKSIGARNSDILKIFLLEAGLIGFIGGLIGAIIGFGLSKFVANLITNTGYLPLRVSFNPTILIISLVAAICIGLISGAVPSYRASKMPPVDALRYD